MLEVTRVRRPLVHTLQALAKKTLTIGYLGGSITDASPCHNWPESVTAWFVRNFPDVRIIVENGALGATGSDLAVFHAQQDLIDRGCDLIFVEYAVNDNGEPPVKRRRTREGLLRKLLKSPADVVLTYTFAQDFYADMIAEKAPASIADMELLAEHYQIPSVWMSLHALREVQAGAMRWEEWLPDGLHPQSRGSLAYADAVTAYLAGELQKGKHVKSAGKKATLPKPMDPLHWESARALPLTDVKTEGPWVFHRWRGVPFFSQILSTAAPGASFSFEFTGRAVVLGFDFGKTSSEFTYSIDGQNPVTVTRERPEWCPVSGGWFRLHTLADDLPVGKHRVEVTVTHGNRTECTGTNFRMAMIGIVE